MINEDEFKEFIINMCSIMFRDFDWFAHSYKEKDVMVITVFNK